MRERPEGLRAVQSFTTNTISGTIEGGAIGAVEGGLYAGYNGQNIAAGALQGGAYGAVIGGVTAGVVDRGLAGIARLRGAPNRTLHSADGYIGQFVEGNVSKEALDKVRLIASGHPTLQRRGFGALFIDTGTAVDKYVKKLHGILLRAPENAVPRGVLAEELQHAIDVTSGFHSSQRIAALESPETTIFDFFLTIDDATAFRRAAQGLPR